MYARWLAVLLLLVLPATGCTPEPIEPTPEAVITVAPIPSADEQLRQALGLDDPLTRRAEVLRATESFLRNPATQQLDDEAFSKHYTETALSSGRLLLSDPSFVRRHNHLALVGLPDGLGLVLYDLGAEPGSPPLELSRWTVGLAAVQTHWMADELGVSYATLGSDGLVRAHYILATEAESGWQVAWVSDEDPDWWLSARGAVLFVSPDLSRLELVGQIENSTRVFIEEGDVPRRVFRSTWLRESNRYVLSPSIGSDRQAWLWQAAEPSAYSTLVEFIERLQAGDEQGASRLTVSPVVFSAALDFGLYFPERRFRVIAYTEDTIVFQDRRGTLVATFQPSSDSTWLVASVAPLGAVPLPPGLLEAPG